MYYSNVWCLKNNMNCTFSFANLSQLLIVLLENTNYYHIYCIYFFGFVQHSIVHKNINFVLLRCNKTNSRKPKVWNPFYRKSRVGWKCIVNRLRIVIVVILLKQYHNPHRKNTWKKLSRHVTLVERVKRNNNKTINNHNAKKKTMIAKLRVKYTLTQLSQLTKRLLEVHWCGLHCLISCTVVEQKVGALVTVPRNVDFLIVLLCDQLWKVHKFTAHVYSLR